MTHEPKVRYSDAELEEFRVLIEDKIRKANEELDFTQRQIGELNENGFNQQGGDMYDDSSTHADLELLQRMALRQQRYIQDLQNAIHRINNKTYGVCIITGQLIDKNRLRLVPHATKSVDGKTIANAAVKTTSGEGGENGDGFSGSPESSRPSGRPIGDKVRLPGNKRPGGGRPGEEWEPDNESIEDAGYRANRKFEDDEE